MTQLQSATNSLFFVFSLSLSPPFILSLPPPLSHSPYLYQSLSPSASILPPPAHEINSLDQFVYIHHLSLNLSMYEKVSVYLSVRMYVQIAAIVRLLSNRQYDKIARLAWNCASFHSTSTVRLIRIMCSTIEPWNVGTVAVD